MRESRTTLAAVVIAFGSVLCGCDGIVGLGDERNLGANENNRCSVRGKGIAWARHFGDASYQDTSSIAVDGSSIYLTGQFGGALDFGDGPLISEGGYDHYLARFDVEGNHLWSKRFGDQHEQKGAIVRVKTTPDGGALYFGEFQGTVDFGDGFPRTADDYVPDAFITRYDLNGTHLWTRVISSVGHDAVTDLVVDPRTAEIVATVRVEGPAMDFVGNPIAHQGFADILLARLNANGDQLWTRHFASAGYETANAVAIDAQGRIAIGGALDAPVDFGDGAKGIVQMPDAFVAVFAETGALGWSKMLPGPDFETVTRIAAHEASGDWVVSGSIRGSMNVDGEVVAAAFGGFVTRLRADGSHVKSRPLSGFFVPRALDVDEAGNTLVSGPLRDITDFGGGPIAAAGEQDGIVGKLGPGLEHLWTLPIGSINDDNAWGVAVDDASNAFVGAYFQQTLQLPGCGELTSAGGADALLIKIDR